LAQIWLIGAIGAVAAGNPGAWRWPVAVPGRFDQRPACTFAGPGPGWAASPGPGQSRWGAR